MKLRRTNNGVRVVDCPWLVAVFPAVGLIVLVQFLWHGSLPKGDNGESALIAIVVFLGLAGFSLIFLKRSVFDFDAIGRRLVWRRRNLWGCKQGVVPFEQISGAVVTSTSSSDSGRSYRVELRTSQGFLPLTEHYSHGLFDGEKACQQVAERINQLLKVNHQQAMDDAILQLALDGRRLDAIAMVRQRYGYDLATAVRFVEGLTDNAHSVWERMKGT